MLNPINMILLPKFVYTMYEFQLPTDPRCLSDLKVRKPMYTLPDLMKCTQFVTDTKTDIITLKFMWLVDSEQYKIKISHGFILSFLNKKTLG